VKTCTAYTRDVGKGIARIDYDTMDSLDASTGDVIEIRAKRRTVAKCLPLYRSDEGNGIIRIDRLIRNNAGIAIGDVISLRKIQAVDADKITITPPEEITEIPGERDLDAYEMFNNPFGKSYIASFLESASVPLIKDDHIQVPFFGVPCTFKVMKISPTADAVLVTKKTKFYFPDELFMIQN